MKNLFAATRPMIYAHRGASAYAPENTLAAFRLAVEQGADGVELDAKLTPDGEVVVIHDQTVERTTGVHGRVIEMTAKELKTLDAGSFFNSQFRGEPIPLLSEVFEAVGGKVLINVELTNYASPTDALPERVAELVIRYGLQDSVFFSSFFPTNLIRVRRKLPHTQVAILALGGTKGNLMRGWVGRLASPRFVHPYYSDVTAAYLQREHAQKRKVNPWTINDPAEMKRLYQIGIDGIITDDPRLARQVLEET